MPHASLELFFDHDGGAHFLLHSSFSNRANTPPNCKLAEEPPRGKYLRALCILFLLAKYKGESPPDADGRIENICFRDKSDRPSWIDTLGMSFGPGTQVDFFRTYFESVRFASAERGTVHTAYRKKIGGGLLPSALFHPEQLRLKNLHLFEVRKDRKTVELKGSRLRWMAEDLEKFEIERGKKWVAIVDDIATDIERWRRPKSRLGLKAKDGFANNGQSESEQDFPFIVSRSYRLLDDIRRYAADVAERGTWYIVCRHPTEFKEWELVFRTAIVQYGSTVKMLYWLPNERDKGYDEQRLRVVQLERDSMSESIRQVPDYVKRNKRLKGSFEFFDSPLMAEFQAILFVPGQLKRFSPERYAPQMPRIKAPKGTWCAAAIDLCPRFFDIKTYLYLNRSSPLLDAYHNSILWLLNRGIECVVIRLAERVEPGQKPIGKQQN